MARRSEPKGRKHGHSASAPRCRLRVRRTCGWHSVTGEQQTACSRQTAAEQPGSAERHVTLATPAVSQADQGRQRAAGHPAPTVTAGVAPATHLWRRDREAARPPAEAWSSEERGARSAGPVRCSGAVLLRAGCNASTLLRLRGQSAARWTGLVHCARVQGSGPAWCGSANRPVRRSTALKLRKSDFVPKDQ